MFYQRRNKLNRVREKYCQIAGLSAGTLAASAVGGATTAEVGALTSGGKGGSSTPTTPAQVATYDPSMLANQQSAANTSAANQSVNLLNANVNTPQGSSSYTKSTDTAAYNKALQDWQAKSDQAASVNKQNSDNAAYNYQLMRVMGPNAKQYYKPVNLTANDPGSKPTEDQFQTVSNDKTLSPVEQGLYNQSTGIQSQNNTNISALSALASQLIPSLNSQLTNDRNSTSITDGLKTILGDKYASVMGNATGDVTSKSILGDNYANVMNNAAGNTNVNSILGDNYNNVMNNAAGNTTAQSILGDAYGSVMGNATGTNPDLSSARQSTIDAVLSRLNPQMTTQRNAMNTRLANQGITPGSTAWLNEQKAQGFNENDMANQAELTGNSEYDALQKNALGAWGNAITEAKNTQTGAQSAWNSAENQAYDTTRNAQNAWGISNTQANNMTQNALSAWIQAASQSTNQQNLNQNQAKNDIGNLMSLFNQNYGYTQPDMTTSYQGTAVQPADVLGSYALNNSANATNAGATNAYNTNVYNQGVASTNANKSAGSSTLAALIQALGSYYSKNNNYQNTGTQTNTNLPAVYP